MKVSIKAISERTGFSPATVSNALNHKKGVNADTASEIFRVAKEMGYINENRIRKIKIVVFKHSGMIVEDSPFFSLVIDGIEKGCRETGMEMVLCNLNHGDEDYEKQVDWLIHDHSSAVIFLGTELMEEDVALFKNVTCPFLMLDYWNHDMAFNGVLINNADSARMATEYLIRKGHKRIGYLRGECRIKGFRSRAAGYADALRKAGYPVEKKYTVTLSTTVNGAYEDMKRYLETEPELPSAFFADNDMIALGAVKAMTEKGIRIPQDISVVGFDDLPFSEIANPPLTTLRVPKQEMGRLAVRRIIEIIDQKDGLKTKTQVCTTFIERESVQECNCPDQGTWLLGQRTDRD